MTTATRQSVTALNVAVRSPPSTAARSPTIAPGPSWPRQRPSTSTSSTPPRGRQSSDPGLPWVTSAYCLRRLCSLGLGPPRMIVVESCRSTSLSAPMTCATGRGPHGLRLPNAPLYQFAVLHFDHGAQLQADPGPTPRHGHPPGPSFRWSRWGARARQARPTSRSRPSVRSPSAIPITNGYLQTVSRDSSRTRSNELPDDGPTLLTEW